LATRFFSDSLDPTSPTRSSVRVSLLLNLEMERKRERLGFAMTTGLREATTVAYPSYFPSRQDSRDALKCEKRYDTYGGVRHTADSNLAAVILVTFIPVSGT
jgi:hypothetical protein